jgi:DNA-binding NarL/FixJ family response regulator
MRVVIADDELLLREGLERLLAEVGFEVVGKAANPIELMWMVERTRPDVAIIDIRMPPSHTDEGLVAARELGRTNPATGVLVLSHHLDSRFAGRLLEEHPERVGYLLKERLSDIAVLTDALHRIAEGECVIDATIISRLLRRRRNPDPLGELTEREREVLGLMAEGRSNRAIAGRLVVGDKAIEAHVHNVFMKLQLEEAPDDHRRVLAVLVYLRSAQTGSSPTADDS